MAQVVEERQLVCEDWTPSSFECSGAAELSARIQAAEPLIVPTCRCRLKTDPPPPVEF